MTDILHRYYGEFDLINEKQNEDYESILIRPKDNQEYKRCRLAKKTPKKEGYFTVFWKKDQDNKNILYTDRDLGDELWLLSSSTTVIAVYLSFPKRWLSVKKFSLQRIVKERLLHTEKQSSQGRMLIIPLYHKMNKQLI